MTGQSRHSHRDPAIAPEEIIDRLTKVVPDIFFMDDFQFHHPTVLEYVEEAGWTSPNVQQEKVGVPLQVNKFPFHYLVS